MFDRLSTFVHICSLNKSGTRLSRLCWSRLIPIWKYTSYINGYNDIHTTCVRICKLHNDCLNILLRSLWNTYIHTLPLLIFKFISNSSNTYTLLCIYYIICTRNILATMTSRGSPYASCIRDTLEYTQTSEREKRGKSIIASSQRVTGEIVCLN